MLFCTTACPEGCRREHQEERMPMRSSAGEGRPLTEELAATMTPLMISGLLSIQSGHPALRYGGF